ncbi:hypothetical protein NHX12_012266 [Muraenolepis orangiensis]|uniref:non-specific serine/threonine protein kinase n=1 Tax=Muraenolepis orangiensis TaxID=630683 RepID=A0A9Q0DE09_9TELE|nr:hypothetical protein NHX12_012266 [Muraenolepis orangiensis]
MFRGKPVFLKTYGKRRLRLPPRVSPDGQRASDASSPGELTSSPGELTVSPVSVPRPSASPDISVGMRPVGQFVTTRRRIKLRPGRGQASDSTLDSTDCVALRKSRRLLGNLRPSRRHLSSTHQISAAKISVSDLRALSPVADLRRPEVLPVASAEPSFVILEPSMPLFCSTPSVSQRQGPHPKSSPATLSSVAPPNYTLNNSSLFCLYQEDLDSSEDELFPPKPRLKGRRLSSSHDSNSSQFSDSLRGNSNDPEDGPEDGPPVDGAVAELRDGLKEECLLRRCHVPLHKKVALSQCSERSGLQSIERVKRGTPDVGQCSGSGLAQESPFSDRSGAARKVCVSGLNVSRWKDRSITGTLLVQSRAWRHDASKAGDYSTTELLSTPRQPSKVLTKRLLQGISGAVFTPDTQSWRRLKAALSLHRKTRVFTPRGTSIPFPSMSVLFGDHSLDVSATPTRLPLREHSRASLLSSLSLLKSPSEDERGLSDGDKVYLECGQQGPLSWEEAILHRCVKIGEGVFGEVFSTTNASEETIIPVEGSVMVNGEEQKTFGEILHEIIISNSLKDKPHNQTCGFIRLNDLHCVQGGYPTAMLDAWDHFHQQKGSENDRPDFYDGEQLFLILEFEDLHWGNLLVKSTDMKKATFLLNGTQHSLDTKGVLVSIIDYSLSRLEIDGLTVSCDISADEELFQGQGDYQFDIYRLMRQANSNEWSGYQPHSNVLWIHYLSDKLCSMKFRGSAGQSMRKIKAALTRFHNGVLQYASATDLLNNCPMFQS